jgi:hypothetical protein
MKIALIAVVLLSGCTTGKPGWRAYRCTNVDRINIVCYETGPRFLSQESCDVFAKKVAELDSNTSLTCLETFGRR